MFIFLILHSYIMEYQKKNHDVKELIITATVIIIL